MDPHGSLPEEVVTAFSWAVLAIVPAFAIDTFAVATGIGAARVGGRMKVALTFAAFEGVMPIVGAAVGTALGQRLAMLGVWLGAALLVILGVREAMEGWRELHEADDDDDDDDAPPATPRSAPAGWALLAAGLSVSMDELAAGFAAGASGLPIGVLVPALAGQAVLCTLLGLSVGGRLRRLSGRYGELVAGLVLMVVGVAIALGLR